ncbi:MAG: nitrous oxide reductase family maturation protein NosD [Bacteroidia bacterium]
MLRAETFTICLDCTNYSIKKTIDKAQKGDTLRIQKGVYKEGNISLTKTLVLWGEEGAIVDGEGKCEVFTISADSVILKNLIIENAGVSNLNDWAGVKVNGANYVQLIHNQILNCYFGIYFANATHGIIAENRVAGSQSKQEQTIGNGINAWKCEHLLIKNNHIQGHRDGIYFEFVTQSCISHNISEENLRYGLHFMFSHEDDYLGNLFRKNGAGVAVMYTHKVKMYDNIFEQNWGDAAYGLLLKEIGDSEIECNIFKTNTVGILMEGTSRIQVQYNTFAENGWALKIQASCQDIHFQNNNFQGNSFDVATNGSLVMNTFDGNYWDKYEGYDLNKDKTGDVPFHPASLYAVIVEKMPFAIMLYRSFSVALLDKAEKLIPSFTPEDLKDNRPCMQEILL